MTRKLCWTLLALCCSACAQSTPEQQIVNDAAAAMGGRDRILAVKTLVIEGDGKNGNLGQRKRPKKRQQAAQNPHERRQAKIGDILGDNLWLLKDAGADDGADDDGDGGHGAQGAD